MNQPQTDRDEALRFEKRAALRKWLAANHDRSKGVWLVFEKGKTAQTVTAEAALEEALCHGWIDGQFHRIDEQAYHKWFAPRRGRSHWSEKNKATVARLLAAGKMAAPGLAAVATAKANGSWAAGPAAPITADHITGLEQALGGEKVALENYRRMSPSVRKIYAALYADAKKEETRIRRLAKIVDRLNRNLKPM